MKNNLHFKGLNILSIIILLIGYGFTQTKILNTSSSDSISFPIIPQIFIEGIFSRCEGIAFNGDNHSVFINNLSGSNRDLVISTLEQWLDLDIL